MAITNWPQQERPREKLLNHGAKSLSDAELLAIFLQTGVKGKTALDLARELLQDFGGLKKLINTQPHMLYSKLGLGKAKYAAILAAVELGKRYTTEKLPIGAKIKTIHVAKRFIADNLKDYQLEVFACLFLDTRQRLLAYEELFYGTINEAVVYPREVVKRGLALNAAKVIVAHNHPSGDPNPSLSDQEITRLLKHSLNLVDIQLIDHIIVGLHDNFSLLEAGLL
jgi:DNA repair protein RadC